MLEYIVGSLLAGIVAWLIRVLLHKPKKKTVMPAGETTQKEGEGAADTLARKTILLLEERGLDAFLLEDFRFRTKLRKQDCKDPEQLQKKLQEMMLEVSGHIKLAPIPVTVKFVSSEDKTIDRAGEYDGGAQQIHFYVQEAHEPEQLAAVLCHESAHYFMRSHSLDDWSDKGLNERRTDVMACLIGFGQIMIDGYMVMTKSHYQVVAWEAKSQRVGYLHAGECKAVREVLLQERGRLRKKQSAKKALEDARTHLKHRIAGAKEMHRQVRLQMRTGSAGKAYDVTKLQEALLAMETGDLERRIAACESAVGGDLSQIGHAEEVLMEVCEKLYMILSAYQGSEA